MSLLFGMHDREGMHLVPAGGYCLDTIALSESPPSTDYTRLRDDIHWIVRLNWGYGDTGTFPSAIRLDQYIQKAVDYVLNSRGIYAYIPGNEPNHENERPGGNVISPKYTAQVFTSLRSTIRPFNRECLAITTPVAPYHASPMDWLFYLKEYLVLVANQGGADGIGIHAYVRGGKPEDVFSNDKMRPPLTGQHSGFRTYRDALGVVPSSLKRLPAFITETNPIDGWPDQNSGLIRAIYDEIDTWNGAVGTQKVHCVCLYRYPKYDENAKWAIEGKNGVIEDYKQAVARGYSADKPMQTHLPAAPNNPPPEPKPSTWIRNFDAEAKNRGVKVIEASPVFGKLTWKVIGINWLNKEESQGKHHILVDAKDLNGNRVVGLPIEIIWPTDSAIIRTETKAGEPYSTSYGMSPSRNEFSVRVADGNPSDTVTGIGMGMDTPDGFNAGEHTSTEVFFQQVMNISEPVAPPKPVKQPVPPLIHPVVNKEYRRVTQVFGVNGDYYKRFSVAGVPLKGHNGVDFGTPVNSKIQAVYSGDVVEVGNDPEGYGLYVKLRHFWGETLYAHLSAQLVRVGEHVEMGKQVGWSGNTGNSTGPHLHFGLRVNPYNRADGWGGYSDPLPYLQPQLIPQPTAPILRSAIVSVLRQVAEESGLDFELLASLAWAESSFKPELADGLFQIGPLAWQDFALKVGATDINNPLDNARVGAAYLKWLLERYNNDLWITLYAWNFGPKRVDDGETIPQITKTFANKVIHGRDLLKAVGA